MYMYTYGRLNVEQEDLVDLPIVNLHNLCEIGQR